MKWFLLGLFLNIAVFAWGVLTLAKGAGSRTPFILRVPFGPPIVLAAAFIGVGQLVYMGPLILFARRKKNDDMVKGLIIVASVTFILQAICGGLMLLGNL